MCMTSMIFISRQVTMLLREHIGAAIRAERQNLGMTLRDVADPAGISFGYLSEIETGRKEPSSEIIEAVLQSLGIGVPELIEVVAAMC